MRAHTSKITITVCAMNSGPISTRVLSAGIGFSLAASRLEHHRDATRPSGIMWAMPDPVEPADFYCPNCALPVNDPLLCGDCHAVICRRCGTPLEKVDDLGIG